MTSQITKDFQMKSKLRKLADGGSRGEGGGLSKEAVMAAIAAQRGAPTSAPAPTPAPAPVAVQRPGGDYIRNPRSVLDARERAAGLADGGSAPFGSRGLSGLRDLIPQMEAMGFRQQPAQPDPTGLRAVMPRVKAMGYMDGGRVEGPGGRTDDKVGPVMLSDEEYVLPGDTADAIGRDKLDAIRLATHEFKDGRKESALRGRMDDAPVDNLADGGNPWIADDKGNVRKPNSFGDAAAGPGYQQPRLPPPQPGTAVDPSALRPGSGPRNIYMGAAEDVTPRPAQIANNPTMPAAAKTAQPWTGAPPTNPNVGPGGSREAQAFRNAAGNPFGDAAAASKDALLSRVGSGARSLLNAGGKLGAVGLAGAGIAGGMEPDSTDRYAERFGVSPPTGDGSLGDLAKFSALRAGGFASDMGSALTFGLADKLYRDKQAVDTNMMASSAGAVGGGVFGKGVGNVVGGALDAGAGLVSRGRYKGNAFSKALGGLGGVVGAGTGLYAGKALADAGGGSADSGAGGPVAGAGAPAAAASPTPPLRSDQGPALPVTPDSYQSRRLSEMGVPLDVQNSKPVVDSATGSTRDFLRTGGTDQYQNLGTYGGNGNIYGKADDPSRPGRINNFVGVGAGASPSNEFNGGGSGGVSTSALRGLGKGPSSPGGSGSSGSNSAPADNSAAINARYDKLAKQLSGMYGPKGQGNLARRMLELEQSRSGALDADARNVTSRSNAVLQNSTLRDNAQLEALGRMEQSRATALSQAQAAQIKALQDARKYADDRQDKGEAATNDWIKRRFTSLGPDDKQVFDSGAAAKFTDFLGSGKAMVGPPENRRPLMSLPPQERLAALPDVYQDWSVNEVINSPGGIIGGDRTTNSPGGLVVRSPNLADLANGLPVSEYLGAKIVPGYASNVVERSTDRKVRSVEAIAGDDLERKKAIMRNAGKE